MSHRVLVADDEECIHRILRRALPPEDFSQVDAADGGEALEHAYGDRPDIILLDVDMPGMDGLSVLSELRRDPRTRLIPVILVTGDGAPAQRVKGLESGADDYVVKPFHVEELVARISGALRRQRRAVAVNPLTCLPGSPSIEEEVNGRIAAAEPFAFLYIDIDHFKAYNDVYGYAKGDAMIRETASLLVDRVAAQTGGQGFVGHVGGDDFVVVCRPHEARRLAPRVAAGFDGLVRGFYLDADVRRGFIETRDRQGCWKRFPLASISIGAVTTEARRLTHYGRVVELASEMKAFVKARRSGPASRFAFDRRSDPPDRTWRRRTATPPFRASGACAGCSDGP